MENTLLYINIMTSFLQIPLFAAIVVVLELLGMGLFVLCGICDVSMLKNDKEMAYLMLILAQMFAFCVVQLIFYFQKKWDNHEAVWKSRVRFACVCVGCFVGMMIMTTNVLNVKQLSGGQRVVLFVLTGLNLLGYSFYFISKEKSRLETENRVYQKQSVLYQEWYEGFQQTRKETLAFRHDMNNHFGVLKYLCKNGKKVRNPVEC